MAKKNLNEAPPIDYGDGRERMSPDIEGKLRSQEHPLGGHQAFPDVDRDGIPDNFEELIASQRFKDVVQKVKRRYRFRKHRPTNLYVFTTNVNASRKTYSGNRIPKQRCFRKTSC